MSKWITITERKPEIMESFIGCDSDGGVYECCMWCENEIVSSYMMGKRGVKAKPIDNITHWMPLPRHPSED